MSKTFISLIAITFLFLTCSSKTTTDNATEAIVEPYVYKPIPDNMTLKGMFKATTTKNAASHIE